VREHARVDEVRDRRDPGALECQHEQSGGVRDRRVDVGAVAAERRLAVRAGGDQPVAPLAAPGGDLAQV
jgi:hypothetical protein